MAQFPLGPLDLFPSTCYYIILMHIKFERAPFTLDDYKGLNMFWVQFTLESLLGIDEFIMDFIVKWSPYKFGQTNWDSTWVRSHTYLFELSKQRPIG